MGKDNNNKGGIKTITISGYDDTYLKELTLIYPMDDRKEIYEKRKRIIKKLLNENELPHTTTK